MKTLNRVWFECLNKYKIHIRLNIPIVDLILYTNKRRCLNVLLSSLAYNRLTSLINRPKTELTEDQICDIY